VELYRAQRSAPALLAASPASPIWAVQSATPLQSRSNTIRNRSLNFELNKLAISTSLAGPSLMRRVVGKSPKVIVGLIRMFLSVFRHDVSYLAERRAGRNFRT
jgi:hypothetical protein